MSRALQKMESSSAPPSQTSEQLRKIEDLLLALVESQANLSKRLTNVEQEMITRTNALKSSMQTSEVSLPDSLMNDVNEIKKTLNAQSSTLRVLGETVSDKRVVKTSDGTAVSASELAAFSLMKTLEASQRTMTSSLDDLAKTVGNGRTVRIDVNRLSEHAVGVLDQRLAKAVEQPVQHVESTLEEFEQRVTAIGTQKVSEAVQQVEKVMGKADELVLAVGRAETRIEALESRVTWTAVGRLCLALVPLAAVLLVVGSLTMGVFHALGFGPLLGWAWGSFWTASTWWAKTLIALGALGGVAAFASLVWWGARRLHDEFGSW